MTPCVTFLLEKECGRLLNGSDSVCSTRSTRRQESAGFPVTSVLIMPGGCVEAWRIFAAQCSHLGE